MTKEKLPLGQRLYNMVNPTEIELSEKEDALLRSMFPDVDWERVRCYEGMPWYAQRNFAIAMVVPQTFGRGGVHIHFKHYKHYKGEDRHKISTLVHEAFHVLQYHCTKSLPGGFGYFRRFMRYYFGWYFAAYFRNLFRVKQGSKRSGNFLSRKLYNLRKRISLSSYHSYRYHIMEVPAYNHEARFIEHYGYYKYSTIEEFFEKYPELVCKNAGELPRPPLFAWLFGSFLVAQIALLSPIIESLLWGLAFILGGRRK